MSPCADSGDRRSRVVKGSTAGDLEGVLSGKGVGEVTWDFEAETPELILRYNDVKLGMYRISVCTKQWIVKVIRIGGPLVYCDMRGHRVGVDHPHIWDGSFVQANNATKEEVLRRVERGCKDEALAVVISFLEGFIADLPMCEYLAKAIADKAREGRKG